MSIKKACVGVLILGLVHSAQAQDRLLNVSVLGIASWDEPQVGCTIVNGYRELVVLAEADTSYTDAYLEVKNLYTPNGSTLSNDDWSSLTTYQKQRILDGIGRLPKRKEDAAIVMSANDAAVCAYAYEDRAGTQAGRISVQITDITGTGRAASADTDSTINWLSGR
ncbi:MAG: hypothetical protein KDK05_01315 [Candidatus Competibacteraceae bacterium]|nr:hypothetical protein [Candidatus Competibacteraceae bacterium]